MRVLARGARAALLLVLALASSGATCDPGGAQPDAGPPDASISDAAVADASIADAAPADAPGGDDVAGCDGAVLRRSPADPAARGPHAVGVRTVAVGALTAEVWYPAPPAGGGPRARYDLRAALPPTERGKIPDADNPWQDCDCGRDLPLDDSRGPYPVIVFVHGTASFRHQSLSQVTHWASRGFVVIAADHPGLRLADFLARVCPGNPQGQQDLGRDVAALLAALASPSGDLGFLAGRVDPRRAAVIGHSAGAAAAAGASGRPGVRAIVSMAGNRAVRAAPGLERVLFLGGADDAVVRWTAVQRAYAASASPRHLVGLARGGHLAFSDLCDTRNPEGQDLLAIAREHGVCGADLAGFLFDCSPARLPGPSAWPIVDDATSIVLESTLQCRRDLPDLAAIASRHADVSHVEQSP